jgi:hypothetical protein
MAKIIIERNSEWNNKARKIGIYIDGEKVETINDGETLEFEVTTGTHELLAKIDWCGSKTLSMELSENEEKTIKLSGFKYSTIITPLIFGFMLAYYLSKYAFNLDMNFLIVCVALLFLYPLYFITLGKNSYLILQELK